MVNLGIVGLNEGNGHPFSYSAMFNGFDPVELEKRCPFALIRDYLPRDHRNEIFIEGARVTHVWTQDPDLSEDVSKVAKIPEIVPSYTDLIGEVDAVILARDDPWNHLEMARPFLEAGLPLFIDKQLTSTPEDLEELLSLAGEDYPLMACSPMRYTRDVAAAAETPGIGEVRSIHGMCRVNWMRYGHHLFEGIAVLWGLDVESVRSLNGEEGHDIVQLRYRSGLNVILEFITDVSLPIQFTCFSEGKEPFQVPFSDFVHSFREMMARFAELAGGGKKPISHLEMVDIARVILAGDLSKRSNGTAFSPETLEPVT